MSEVDDDEELNNDDLPGEEYNEEEYNEEDDEFADTNLLEDDRIITEEGQYMKSITYPDLSLSGPYLILQDETDVDTRTYVLKYPDEKLIVKIKNSTDFQILLHEAFVGIFGLNGLNSKYFAKVYRYSSDEQCLPDLVFSTSGLPTSEPQNPDRCESIVYEYINGPILLDYLKTATVEQLCSIYLQIIKALYLAYTKVGFTHYDLHLRNVIVKHDDNTVYPVIIDYGTSHIIYRRKHYGIDSYQYSIAPRQYWVHDIIKLLLHTYTEINQDYVLNMTRPMIEWIKQDIETIVNRIATTKSKYLKEILGRRIEHRSGTMNFLINRWRERSDAKFHAQSDFLPYVIKLLEFVFPGQTINDEFVASLERKNLWFMSPKKWNTDPINTKEKFLEFFLLAHEILE